jgi:hypothetical protein
VELDVLRFDALLDAADVAQLNEISANRRVRVEFLVAVEGRDVLVGIVRVRPSVQVLELEHTVS